jgi:hypothetical protein
MWLVVAANAGEKSILHQVKLALPWCWCRATEIALLFY